MAVARARTAALLVDELVVNALQHAGAPVEVRLALQPDAVEVAVRDGSPRLPQLSTRSPRRARSETPHRRRARRSLGLDREPAARRCGFAWARLNRGMPANPAEVRNARQLRSPSMADMITISIDPTVMRLTPRLRKSASHHPSRSGPDARRPEKPRITNAIPRLSRFSGFARNHARTRLWRPPARSVPMPPPAARRLVPPPASGQ